MRFAHRRSETTIETVLQGRSLADRDDLADVSAFVADLRHVFAGEPAHPSLSPAVRPIEARTLSRVRLAFAAAVGGATLAFGGFASAGALPDSVQREVARVADRFGLGFVPTPETQEPTGDDAPAGNGTPGSESDDPTGASGGTAGGDSGSSDADEPHTDDSEPGSDDSGDEGSDGGSDGSDHSQPDDADGDDDNSGPNDDDDDGDDDNNSGPSDDDHAEDPTDDPEDPEPSEPDDATDDSGSSDEHAEDPTDDPDDNSGSGSSGSGSSDGEEAASA